MGIYFLGEILKAMGQKRKEKLERHGKGKEPLSPAGWESRDFHKQDMGYVESRNKPQAHGPRIRRAPWTPLICAVTSPT